MTEAAQPPENIKPRPSTDKETLRGEILACGFDRVGFGAVGALADYPRFEQWLASGHAGGMSYMEDQRDPRRDPALLLPTARSVIVVALNYHKADPGSKDSRRPGHGWVSRYAWGRDYHKVLKSRLRKAALMLTQKYGAKATRVAVDTAPLLERSLAAAAGLGWIAKNTMLIDTKLGSYTFLGVLLSDLVIAPDDKLVSDHCGTCTACLEACPTEAFPEAGVLDARRCISYLTIEHKGAIAPKLSALMGDHVFGCDICQEVCPWNRKAPETTVDDFRPRDGVRQPALAPLMELDREGLLSRFAGTPLMRAGVEGLRRNARIANENENRLK